MQEALLGPYGSSETSGRVARRPIGHVLNDQCRGLFGGNVGSELAYSIALGATCLAYGVHLNVAQLVFVKTSAAVLSGLIPVPGGIGAAEAAVSAGLITMGVDESTAFAIAITQRLSTFYLSPIWGYFSLQWPICKGYV